MRTGYQQIFVIVANEGFLFFYYIEDKLVAYVDVRGFCMSIVWFASILQYLLSIKFNCNFQANIFSMKWMWILFNHSFSNEWTFASKCILPLHKILLFISLLLQCDVGDSIAEVAKSQSDPPTTSIKGHIWKFYFMFYSFYL